MNPVEIVVGCLRGSLRIPGASVRHREDASLADTSFPMCPEVTAKEAALLAPGTARGECAPHRLF